MTRKRGRSSTENGKAGPNNLKELACLLDMNVDAAYFGNSKSEVEELSKSAFILTSCYSGTGAAEMAAHALMRCVNELVRGNGQVICHAACDKAAASQEALLGHVGMDTSFYGSHNIHHSGPLHVFRNVMERLPADTRQEIVVIEEEIFKRHESLQARCQEGLISTTELKHEQQHLAVELVNSLKHLLADVEYLEEAYCIRHQKMCPVNPRSVAGQENMLWVEVAGTTCCPFSAMGAGLEWLDRATAPCLVWAFSTLFYLPDLILHECTPRFSEGTLLDILEDVGDAGHSVHARATPDGQQLRYRMESAIFSPCDLGVPSQRKRKYSAFFLHPFIGPPAVPFLTQFGRDLVLDASIYLIASPEQIEAEHRNMAASSSSVDQDLLESAAWSEVQWCLGAGDIDRLEGYQVCPLKFLIQSRW